MCSKTNLESGWLEESINSSSESIPNMIDCSDRYIEIKIFNVGKCSRELFGSVLKESAEKSSKFCDF